MDRRLFWLLAGALVAIAAYMLIGARGNWGFVLPFRGTKLAVMLLVAVSVSTSTVLFQTITQNQLLTPSILGFDALYILTLTTAVFVLGGPAYQAIPPQPQFLFNTALMLGASLALFGTVLGKLKADVLRMVLTGVIFGALFRALTGLMQRMIDPNEYAVIQGGAFARFAHVSPDLLVIAGLACLIALGLAWQMRHRLDIWQLGRTRAISLGEAPDRAIWPVLILVSVLVSVSTALVGPISAGLAGSNVFLGLLAASIARRLTPSARHATLLPSAALISCIILIGGQALLERLLKFSTPVTTVIDILGGLLFLTLILREFRR